MEIYLSCAVREYSRPSIKPFFSFEDKFFLESFYYINSPMTEYLDKSGKVLLDSGAFTFMNSQKDGCDFLSYADRYCDFINSNNFKYFFELDVDSVTGLPYVEKLRKRIEQKTGKQTIPVWHKSRGLDYFKGLCREYDYIAIGGIVSGEIKRGEYPALKFFIDYAHDHDTKIHGLGFTNPKLLKKLRFDSVDSTTWLSGCMRKTCMKFNERSGEFKVYKAPENWSYKNREEINAYNLSEWFKFQRWAYKYL